MAYEDLTLKEYFSLKYRESLSIDPWNDKEIYFGDSQLIDRIKRRLETDFVQPRGVPKFFVHGAYGSGKTHTLAHISHELEQNTMHLSEPIYVDIAPLRARDGFQRIYSRLLDAVGLDRVREAAERVADEIKETDKIQAMLDKNVLTHGDSTLKVSQANVFRNVLYGGRQTQLSWEWMKGRKNTPDQATMLGVQKDLTEPADLVSCLLNVGSLYYLGTGKKAVFLVDEVEAIRSVTNSDSLDEIQHMLRLLLENSNTVVGLVLAVQAEGGMEDIGDVFTREDIRRRVDFDLGFIDLASLVSQVSSAREFMELVLEYLVDQSKADDVIRSESLNTKKELFPFEESAVDAICQHVADNPQLASPAFIISTMSNAAVEAWRKRAEQDIHVLVDDQIVEETIFPEG